MLVLLLVLLGRWVVGLVSGKVSSVAVPSDQCVATVGGSEYSLDLDQSRNAAIITAESIRRGLPARAASIALATAMQESKLYNINYGDRDSLGLFQQRPSQGWGTAAQIMDPWYAAGQFYDHLVKVSDWQTGDLNDVAQEVQKSGAPTAYAAHVPAAKAWASTLTGQSPAALTCIAQPTGTTSASAGTQLVKTAFGSKVSITTGQALVTLTAKDRTTAWAATQLLLATTQKTGVVKIDLDGQSWTASTTQIAAWQGTARNQGTEATVTVQA